MLLEIGRLKLEQLNGDFRQLKLEKKPVMLVLSEETKVATLVAGFLATRSNDQGTPYNDSHVLVIHSELSKSELDLARRRLGLIDDNEDPLDVVVSVLMLREGFDKKNIAVIAVTSQRTRWIFCSLLSTRGSAPSTRISASRASS
jgi:type III restriction enzyme